MDGLAPDIQPLLNPARPRGRMAAVPTGAGHAAPAALPVDTIARLAQDVAEPLQAGQSNAATGDEAPSTVLTVRRSRRFQAPRPLRQAPRAGIPQLLPAYHRPPELPPFHFNALPRQNIGANGFGRDAHIAPPGVNANLHIAPPAGNGNPHIALPAQNGNPQIALPAHNNVGPQAAPFNLAAMIEAHHDLNLEQAGGLHIIPNAPAHNAILPRYNRPVEIDHANVDALHETQAQALARDAAEIARNADVLDEPLAIARGDQPRFHARAEALAFVRKSDTQIINELRAGEGHQAPKPEQDFNPYQELCHRATEGYKDALSELAQSEAFPKHEVQKLQRRFAVIDHDKFLYAQLIKQYAKSPRMKVAVGGLFVAGIAVDCAGGCGVGSFLLGATAATKLGTAVALGGSAAAASAQTLLLHAQFEASSHYISKDYTYGLSDIRERASQVHSKAPHALNDSTCSLYTSAENKKILEQHVGKECLEQLGKSSGRVNHNFEKYIGAVKETKYPYLHSPQWDFAERGGKKAAVALTANLARETRLIRELASSLPEPER